MAVKYKVPRSIKSWVLANIILAYGLFDEWRVFCYNHPKLKSNYRSASLFLLHKKLRYAPVDNPIKVNMDSICDYYYA